MVEQQHQAPRAAENEAARRISFCVGQAEQQLGLENGYRQPWPQRLDLILSTALVRGDLDPDSYKICFLLRRSWSNEPNSSCETEART